MNIFKTKKKRTKKYKIDGMDCESCASLIESDLEDQNISAKCSYAKQTLEVEKGSDIKKVKSVIKKAGYKLTSR